MSDFSPREIVSELDRFVVGHAEAKRAVAVALRNRWRRRRVPEALRDEITPKNILMIGPTGVGKTEIARRLAKLAQAPFLKVEATKFTEVGYVGRDVDQIVRDLVEIAIGMIRERRRAGVKAKAEAAAEERILDALVGPGSGPTTRDAFRKKLRAGELDDKEVELTLADASSPFQGIDIPGQPGASMGVLNLSEMMGKAFGQRTKAHRTTVAEPPGPADRRGERQAGRPGGRDAGGDLAGGEFRLSSSSTRSTRWPRARTAPAPTSPAKACSATCCR